ncbi:MAG: HAMP domain-containing histidine kinase [Lachnospiraceae bacterium]|nr:HAMP domain-containing histidine kinase [Lachnospiraceae bacterium]
MRRYDRICIGIFLAVILIFVYINIAFYVAPNDTSGRESNVEIERLSRQIEEGELPDIDGCKYVSNIEEFEYKDNRTGDVDIKEFINSSSDYVIKEINGRLYRFDYNHITDRNGKLKLKINVCMTAMIVIFLFVLIYIRNQILKPFFKLSDIPYELAKGNLTVPIEESKNRFFGRFTWGVDMLRETLEEQKKKELEMQKDKQTLLLSISHDIKTPLSAIKLYAKSLSKGLYKDKEKQTEVAENINDKADEIESYVTELTDTARDSFMEFDVKEGEFYLSELIDNIRNYYTDKLLLNKTEFTINKFTDCILNGDIDRSIEVLQNIMENAIKYGDGKAIDIIFSDEEDCRLVTITNTGCTLPEAELVHIFDSFWRGSNADNKSGSGLGLYICRQLMIGMNGDIFAEVKDDKMKVTTVFRRS